MTSEDLNQLDRIELVLKMILSELHARPQKQKVRRIPAPVNPPTKEALDIADARLAANGYLRR